MSRESNVRLHEDLIQAVSFKLSCTLQVQEDKDWDGWVQEAFRSLDSNEDGVICEDDMRIISTDLDKVCAAVILSTLCSCYLKTS